MQLVWKLNYDRDFPRPPVDSRQLPTDNGIIY